MNIKNITDVTSLENSYKGEIFVYVKNNSFDSVKDFIDTNNLIAFIENENSIYAQGHKYTGLTNEQIEECFLNRETRNVRNDATISFRDMLYEVPQEFIKKKIVIKYKPTQIDELYIYNDKNERVCSIKVIDKVSNSKMKRNEKISMYRKEEEQK